MLLRPEKTPEETPEKNQEETPEKTPEETPEKTPEETQDFLQSLYFALFTWELGSSHTEQVITKI